MGHFATGVTVITSVDADGEPVGTTANAVTSLSLDPPLVIVCFDLGSLTLRAVRGHGAFVVNVLAAPQQHLSRNFARRGLAAAWDEVRHRRGPTGSPRLEDVLAVLECTVEHALPGGDHEIIASRVSHVDPNSPLVFFRGRCASLLPACGAAELAGAGARRIRGGRFLRIWARRRRRADDARRAGSDVVAAAGGPPGPARFLAGRRRVSSGT
jgi:flavin reductase (DIM6/NTAB) family NADH-FMN oxidoreductase RutF